MGMILTTIFPTVKNGMMEEKHVRTPTHLLKTLMVVVTAFVLGAGFTIVNNSAGIFTIVAWADEIHTDYCIWCKFI